MVTKNKMVWSPTKSNDFKNIVRDIKKLSTSGIYSSQNVFFKNDVFNYICSLESDSSLDYAKRNIILDTLLCARKYSPGTEVLLADMIVSADSYNTERVCRISSGEAASLTKSKIKNRKAQRIFQSIVDLMGTTGRIHITEEPISSTEIKLSEGCEINITIDHRFASQSNVKNIKFDFVNVCIIEGAPASVSEINRLLTHCHENNTVLLLLARSFPEEVINTLSVNWNSKKLRVMPYVYGDSVYNINSHADLAAVSGAIPVSQMFGDSLSSDLTEKFGSLLQFVNREKKVIAKPTCDPKRLINDLKTKLSKVDWSNHDSVEIITRRISALSDKTLYVKIAKSQESWRIKNEIDIAIAQYNSYCRKTIIVKRNGKLEKLPYDIYKKATELQNTFRTLTEKIGGFIVYCDKKH